MSRAVVAESVTAHSTSSLPDALATKMGDSCWRSLGGVFNLQQMGVNFEVLAPGALSSLRHWHSKSEEFIYILDGELLLISDAGEELLGEGMCVGFVAGNNNAHHLKNISKHDARFLVVGTRVAGDKVQYPDDNLQWLPDEQGVIRAARKNGGFC